MMGSQREKKKEDTHSVLGFKQPSMQMVTQKQARPRGGKRRTMKQSDSVLCANSIQCNPKCFSKSARG